MMLIGGMALGIAVCLMLQPVPYCRVCRKRLEDEDWRL